MSTIPPLQPQLASNPPLPYIGQPDYVAQLIKCLEWSHPSNLFDSRIFVGMLIAMVVGEKNLIVDVDVDDLMEPYRAASKQSLASEQSELREYKNDELKLEVRQAVAQTEGRVRKIVEYLSSSIFGLTCHSTCVSSRWTPLEAPGCLFPFVDRGHHRLDLFSRAAATSESDQHTHHDFQSNDPWPRPFRIDDGGLKPQANSAKTVSSSSASRDPCHTRRKEHHRANLLEETQRILPQVLVLTKLHKASTAVQAKIWDMLYQRKLARSDCGTLLDPMRAVPSENDPKLKWDDGAKLDQELDRLPSGFFVVWIRLSVDKHRNISRCLLDHFALSCSASDWGACQAENEDASDRRTTAEIDPVLDSEYIWVLRRLANKTHMHPPLRQQISDLVTSLLSAPSLSVNLTSISVTELKAFVRVSRVLFRPFMWRAELLNPKITGRQYDQRKKLQEAMDQEEWYATVEDVKRVWTNAIKHRVRVRNDNLTFRRGPGNGGCTELITPPSWPKERLRRTSDDDSVCSALKSKQTLGQAVQSGRREDQVLARILQSIMERCADC